MRNLQKGQTRAYPATRYDRGHDSLASVGASAKCAQLHMHTRTCSATSSQARAHTHMQTRMPRTSQISKLLPLISTMSDDAGVSRYLNAALQESGE